MRDAARSWPPGVNVFSPLIIQVIHFSRKRSLNGLFKQTSRGWTRLVRPPGITAVAVLFSWSCCFTVSVRWALNESQTSKLWVFANPPGRARQTFSIQILSPLSSIHPFGWLCTTTPAGKLSFGIVFPLLTLFWSNSKVMYVQAGVSFDQWNGAFCFHLGQSELRVLCHVFHLMLTTWSSSTACNFEKLL